MQINTFNPPPYSTFLKKVEKTLVKADRRNVAWFKRNPLRTAVYHNASKEYENKSFSVERAAVEQIWSLCHYTAPVALTHIAPRKSYIGNEEAIAKASTFRIFYKEVLEQFPQIHSGLENLKNRLCAPSIEGYGESFLCNIYGGAHVFVIEKRSQDCCVIYQSYANHYTYDEFLKDESKQINWKPEDILQLLSEIISDKNTLDARISKFKELFFVPIPKNNLEHVTEVYDSHQLVFVKTAPYALADQPEKLKLSFED